MWVSLVRNHSSWGISKMGKSQNNTGSLLLLIILGISLGDSMPLEDMDSQEMIDLTDLGDTLFGNPDVETTGALVEALGVESPLNPEELGTYHEGDILIPLSYRDARFNGTRNGILALSSRWPGGVVPYEIKGPFTSQELGNINHAFKVRF